MAYFDHCATTPLDPRVAEAMQPWLVGDAGNPSSMHRFGRACRAAIEQARAQVAAFIDARTSQVIFTPSGTTANNLALLGYLAHDQGRRLWLSRIEHSSVAAVAQSLAPERVSWMATDAQGILSLAQQPFEEAKAHDLLAVMLANNETGVIEPVADLAAQARRQGLRVHCDAVQAAAKMPVSFAQLEVDSLTISSHKIYGPLGASALIVRNCADLDPIVFGGGHECGLFSGTENTAAIVGFGLACQLAASELGERSGHVGRLQDKLEHRLAADFGAVIFGQEAPRLPGVTMFAIPGIHGEMLVMHCDQEGFAVSSGSACHSTVTRPSPVLSSMGVDENLALSAVRLSLGAGNTEAEIGEFLSKLRKILDSLMLDYGTTGVGASSAQASSPH